MGKGRSLGGRCGAATLPGDPGAAFSSQHKVYIITGLDMCEVCTEAVHSVASGTRVTSREALNQNSPTWIS